MAVWKKFGWSSLAVAAAVLAAASHSETTGAENGAEAVDGVVCVMDVVVETRSQLGTLVGVETYQREFVLEEGGTYFDDFSTRTRFKFFNASMVKEHGDRTIAIAWFADVTVFNSVDLDTYVVLADGQKQGQTGGEHRFFTSSGSTTTRYSLRCVEN